MTPNDIIKLVNAGFTKQDIIAMSRGKSEETVKPEPIIEKTVQPLGQLLQQVQNLQNSVYTNNMYMQQPPEKGVDDILATIISPGGATNG